MKMKPDEYLRRWQAMFRAADVDDDAEFWRQYAEFLEATEAISRERMLLQRMSRRAADILTAKG